MADWLTWNVQVVNQTETFWA